MEVKTSSDVGTNFATLMKMLEPVIKFVLEHEDPTDRSVLLSSCVYIMSKSFKLTPISVMGTLFSIAASSNSDAGDRAKLYSRLGLQAVADK